MSFSNPFTWGKINKKEKKKEIKFSTGINKRCLRCDKIVLHSKNSKIMMEIPYKIRYGMVTHKFWVLCKECQKKIKERDKHGKKYRSQKTRKKK